MSFSIGDTVLLKVPENPRLHRTKATVRELTNWGAHVFAEAAATNRFRALFSEMILLHSYNGKLSTAVDQGYSGEICIRCGGVRMRRAGSCLTCEDCGDNSGCG